MKKISDTEVQNLIDDTNSVFGEYEKVKFTVKIKGNPVILEGIRLVNDVKEDFVVKDSKGDHYSFGADEVLQFKVTSVVKEFEDEVNYNPIAGLQKTIVEKIQREKQKTADESEAIAGELANTVGYFPLLKQVTFAGVTIDFYNKSHEHQDTIYFPFTRGEGYEVFSHEEDRNIEVFSMMVDISLATNENDEDVPVEHFAKYYETYKAIQDLEFIPDNNHTGEIFDIYQLDKKYAKVVGDISKHDLLSLVSEYSKDKNIIEAAKDLRAKKKPLNKIKY